MFLFPVIKPLSLFRLFTLSFSFPHHTHLIFLHSDVPFKFFGFAFVPTFYCIRPGELCLSSPSAAGDYGCNHLKSFFSLPQNLYHSGLIHLLRLTLKLLSVGFIEHGFSPWPRCGGNDHFMVLHEQVKGTYSFAPGETRGMMLFDISLKLWPDVQIWLHPVNMACITVKRDIICTCECLHVKQKALPFMLKADKAQCLLYSHGQIS